MREIKDEKLLRYYLEQYHIEDIFDTKNLPFQLFEYEKGEMLNICHAPKDYLKFIVNGEWKVFRRQLHRVLKKLADEKVILKQDNKYVLTRIDNL